MILPQIEVIGIYNSQIIGPNNHVTKNRTTTMFELELPMEDGGISHINSDYLPITTNMIICAKPGQVRHTRFPFKCYYIHLTINEGYLYDMLMSFPDFFSIEDIGKYQEIFKNLCKYYETRTKQDEIIQQSLVLELIYMLSKDVHIQTQNSKFKSNRFDIDKALKYIKENLTENLSLQTVADHVMLSPIHFHNCFKSAVGKTLHEYVEEQRIKVAVNLLLTTDLTLTQIAFQCGFSSQSYFSYVFKRKMKMTPRKYVEQLNNMYEK